MAHINQDRFAGQPRVGRFADLGLDENEGRGPPSCPRLPIFYFSFKVLAITVFVRWSFRSRGPKQKARKTWKLQHQLAYLFSRKLGLCRNLRLQPMRAASIGHGYPQESHLIAILVDRGSANLTAIVDALSEDQVERSWESQSIEIVARTALIKERPCAFKTTRRLTHDLVIVVNVESDIVGVTADGKNFYHSSPLGPDEAGGRKACILIAARVTKADNNTPIIDGGRGVPGATSNVPEIDRHRLTLFPK